MEENFMKKALAILLIAALSLAALVGCAGDSNSSSFSDSREINVVSREEGSGTRGAFIELLGIQVRTDDGNVDMTTREAIIADGTSVVMTNVANDTYAIGYISQGSLNDTVKALNVDGAAPTVDNIKNGSYPISRPFNIAYKGDLSELAADFIDFIFSQEGQAVVEDRNYITVSNNPAYSGSRPAGRIVIDGSSSVHPLMERLVEAYRAINEEATIEVHMTDSSSGMQAAINGTADIGMASRELREAEMAELSHQAIAIDGIAVIVNNDNPVDNLTSEQIKEIYIGEATVWSSVR